MKCPNCGNTVKLRAGIAVALLRGEPEDLPDAVTDDSRYVDNVICTIAECTASKKICGYNVAGFMLNGTFFDDHAMIPLGELWDWVNRNRKRQIAHHYPDGEPSD